MFADGRPLVALALAGHSDRQKKPIKTNLSYRPCAPLVVILHCRRLRQNTQVTVVAGVFD
jgi:hypothetical protein